MTDNNQTWEEEFNKKFCFNNFDGYETRISLYTNRDQTDNIKAFIRQVEQQAKKEEQEKKYRELGNLFKNLVASKDNVDKFWDIINSLQKGAK